MPDEADKMKERSNVQFIAILFRIIVRFLVFSLEPFKSQKFNLREDLNKNCLQPSDSLIISLFALKAAFFLLSASFQ